MGAPEPARGAARIEPRGLLALALGFGLLAALLPLSPPYDLDVFLRAGRDLWHGVPVYPAVGAPAVYSGSAFVYPLFMAWLFAPLAALPHSLAVAIFVGGSAALVVAAVLATTGGSLLAVPLVLATSYLITGLQLGALSPLLFAGVLGMWRLRERPWSFGLLAAVVVGSKLFLAPLLLWPLLAGRGRAAMRAAGATFVLVAAGFAFGPIGPAAYARLLGRLGAHEAMAGFGLISELRREAAAPVAAYAIAVVLAAGVMGAAALAHRRGREEGVLLAGAIVASLLLSPVVWSHYLVLLLAGALVLRASVGWLAVMTVASWVIAAPHGVRATTDSAVVHELALAAQVAFVLWCGRRGLAGPARGGWLTPRR